ncbi:MAG: Aspartate carbamoyltransferase catalytic subunit [Syntrophomonadaceae bacterium]|nr:Aspartate carbamoyltransferase catalytic subunit [Bacillota bacterium]
MKHIISINDFKKEEIDEIVNGGAEMIPYVNKKTLPPAAVLKDKPKVCLLFLEPSTRTLGSYEEAARLLGWPTRIVSGPEATSLMKKESFANTIRMFATQGAEILIIRSKEEGTARFAAEILEKSGFNNISIQNAGDGANQHPSQTFLDRLTILQTLGRLKNFTFGFVGDLKHSRTVHSLISSFTPEDKIQFKLVSCQETRLSPRYKRGLNILESESLNILRDCDVVYVTRIQEERFSDPLELERVKGRYKITKDVLDGWKKEVKIMHPMPYVDEISAEIRSDPRVIIDKQAWYGIPTRMNLLLWGNEHRFEKTLIPKMPELKKEIIKEAEIDQYLTSRKKEEKYFRPIRNGTVLDHLPFGTGDKIKKCLQTNKIFKQNNVIHNIERIPSQKLGIKDILVLENVFIPEHLFGLISFIAPQITFNILKDNKIRKIKAIVPEEISGVNSLPRCPNNLCITNYDPEGITKFKILQFPKSGENFLLRCNHCEREFTREEIIKII